MDEKKLRWAGRNSEKDKLRARVWTALEEERAAVGHVWESIPDFAGAEEAAERLSQLPFWKSARVVKSNPDAPQIPVRFRALRDGKYLYMPVPELTADFPFVMLDPEELKKKGVSFEEAAEIEGALKYGRKVQFTEMLPMDVLVVGCVAVTPDGGRTGKGGGFADLELGIFYEVGTVPKNAKIVTTVHDLQVVGSGELPLQPHDSPLDWIVTPTRALETQTTFPRPTGVHWQAVREDQYQSIPFLRRLRAEYEKRSA